MANISTQAVRVPNPHKNIGFTRYGLGYYLQLPLTRKQGRMDSYPVVEAQERCMRWRDSLKGVLQP